MEHGHARRGMITPTYRSWQMMKNRCTNTNDPNYSRYGARGISYPIEWNSFESFLLDMGERELWQTLDRIDNSLGYSKENCRWADWSTQQSNKGLYRNNHLGIRGVRKWKGSFQARGTVNGITELLYMGPDLELAIEARLAWENLRG